VACFVGTTGKVSSKQINNIVFFDRARLKDFLYGENLMKDGFLQRFVAPEVRPCGVEWRVRAWFVSPWTRTARCMHGI
jgi:hypothetical protein